MAVRISRALLDRILTHAAGEPDREVCGLLTGAVDAIADAIETPNRSENASDSFEIDPAILFDVIRAARAGGPALIGHYHSHPGGPAAPSARDAAAARDAGRLWMIVAGAEATLWRSGAADGLHRCFAPVELTIEAGCVVA